MATKPHRYTPEPPFWGAIEQYRKRCHRFPKVCIWCGTKLPKRKRSWCCMECVNQKRLLYEPKMTKRLLAWHRGDPLEGTVEEDSIHGKLYFQPHRV